MQIMPLLFLKVQGGGIQSKTYLTSASYLNKILQQTSAFLNESHFYNKHKNQSIHNLSTTSVPLSDSNSYVFFFKFINPIYTSQIFQLRDWICSRALDFQQAPGIVFGGIIDPSIWRGSQVWARWVNNNPSRKNIAISTVSIRRSCLFFCIYAMFHCRGLNSFL